MCGHDPPNQRRSTTATDAPSARALWEAASPAGPAPMITKSKRAWRHGAGRSWRAGRARLSRRRPRCRRASYRRTAAVTETLRLSATPSIGSETAVTPAPVQASVSPSASEPRTSATGPRRSASVYGRSAPTRAANIADPAAREPGPDRGRLPAATGTANTVPSEARIAFGLNRSVRGSATTTASAPAASAERRTAPRLPGFSTPSSTTTSGSGAARPQVGRGRCPGCARSRRRPPSARRIPAGRGPRRSPARSPRRRNARPRRPSRHPRSARAPRRRPRRPARHPPAPA